MARGKETKQWRYSTLGIVLVAASSVLNPSHGDLTPKPRLERSPAARYTAQQVEHYLSAQDVTYVRPGYRIILNSFTIPADRRPVADVTFLDDLDQPLDRDGKVTPGACSASFILAWYDAAHRDYVSYTTRVQKSPITGVSAIQAAADSNGTWTELELGHYTYKFGTALPAGFDLTKTTRWASTAAAHLTDIIGKDYYANNINFDFRPDGAAVTEKWDAIDDGDLQRLPRPALGSRRLRAATVKLCVLCHTRRSRSTRDTGNTVRLQGHDPQDPHGREPANGSSTAATTAFGATRLLDRDLPAGHPQLHHLPQGRRRRGRHLVHQPDPQGVRLLPRHRSTGRPARTTAPARRPTTPRAPTATSPQGELEFDVSVKGAHTIPLKSTQLKGLKIAGQEHHQHRHRPEADRDLQAHQRRRQLVDPTTLNRVRLPPSVVRPPTTASTSARPDSRQRHRQRRQLDLQLQHRHPRRRHGILDARLPTSTATSRSTRADGGSPRGRHEPDRSPSRSPTPGGRAPRPSSTRPSATSATMSSALHGGQRTKVDGVRDLPQPHEPRLAVDRRAGANESIALKWMIHRIHTGEELDRDYVYASATSTSTRCATRATAATARPATRPAPTACRCRTTCCRRRRRATSTSPMAAGAASCLSCHDSVDAAAHAYTNTAPFGESCASCHGTDAEFAVAKVHAR